MKAIWKLILVMGLLLVLAGCEDGTPTATIVAPTATAATTVAAPTATHAEIVSSVPTATEAGAVIPAPAATEAGAAEPTAAATEVGAKTPAATEVAAPPAPTVIIQSAIPDPVNVRGGTAATIADTTSYYRLQTILSNTEGRCLEGNEPAPGAILEGTAFMDNCQNVTGQLWKLVPGDAPGYYKLQTKYLESADRCLEGNHFTSDAVLHGAAFMDVCQNVTGQQWKFVAADDGAYRLQTAFQEPENKCLEGNRLAEGAILGGAAFMDDCKAVTGQVWKIVPVAANEVSSAQTVEAVTLQYSAPYIIANTGVYYRLQTLLKNDEAKCLEGNQVADGAVLGGAAFMDNCQDVVGQMWNVIPTDHWGYYALKTKFLEDQAKCFDGSQLSPDALLHGAAYMNDCNNEPGQLWRLVAEGPNTYRLQTQSLAAQDKCLEGNRRADESVLGGAAFMDTCQQASGQLWQLIPIAGSKTNNNNTDILTPP